MGWQLPRFAPYPADPRRGRGEALEAARRAVGDGVPRAGLSARGALQLSAPPRLGARRCGSLGRDEAIRLFDIDGVGRAPSRMDYAKLTNLNGIYLRQADDGRLTREVLARLAPGPGSVLDDGGGAAHPRADAGTEGAGEDLGRTGRCRCVPGAHRPAAVGAEGRCRADVRRRGQMLRDLAPVLGGDGFLAGRARRGAAPFRRSRPGGSSGRWRSRCAPRSPAARSARGSTRRSLRSGARRRWPASAPSRLSDGRIVRAVYHGCIRPSGWRSGCIGFGAGRSKARSCGGEFVVAAVASRARWRSACGCWYPERLAGQRGWTGMSSPWRRRWFWVGRPMLCAGLAWPCGAAGISPAIGAARSR